MGNLVLEGGDLRGAGGGLHLLLQAGYFAVALLDVELLRAAQGLFFGEGFVGFGERDLGFGTRGLRGSDAAWSLGELLAEAFELEVHGLERDEVFEVGVHKAEGGA